MGGIITKAKLEKIRARIEGLRGGIHSVEDDDLISVAESLGRQKSKKGKHPTYESLLMPEKNPISIPHPIKGSGTKRNILDQLEADVIGLLDRLNEQEKRNDPKRLSAGTVRKSGNPR